MSIERMITIHAKEEISGRRNGGGSNVRRRLPSNIARVRRRETTCSKLNGAEPEITRRGVIPIENNVSIRGGRVEDGRRIGDRRREEHGPETAASVWIQDRLKRYDRVL